jgi:hypothetical protein
LGHVSPLYYRNGDHFPQYNTVCWYLQSINVIGLCLQLI